MAFRPRTAPLRYDALRVERLRDRLDGSAFVPGKAENLPDHLCLCRHHDEILRGGIVPVAVRIRHPEELALLRGLSHPHVDPLARLFRLQLGDPLEHVHDKSACGRGRVERLRRRHEVFARSREVVHHRHEIAGVSVDTIHFQDEDRVPEVSLSEHPIICGTPHIATAVAVVDIFAGHGPTLRAGKRMKSSPLGGQRETLFRLVLRRNSGVEGDAFRGVGRTRCRRGLSPTGLRRQSPGFARYALIIHPDLPVTLI